MGTKSSKVSPLTENQTNDGLHLVWLNQITTDSKNDHECQLLRGIVDCLQIFDNADACVDFITHPGRAKLILIISSPLAEFLISIIHDFKSIITIYIYSNEQHILNIQCSYPKLKGTSNNIVKLMNDLKERVRIFRWFRPIEFTTTTANPNIKDDNLSALDTDLSFLFGSLIQHIFLKAPVYKHERDEFIEYCRTRFARDKSKLNNLKKFERDYRSDKAVLWYTKDTFIFKILNQALREQDFNLLFIMRFFIRDLAEQLDKIKKVDPSRKTEPIVTLYRGQGMSKIDFDRRIKRKVGGFLSVHEFLSTSLNPIVAEMFVMYQPNVESIIFEITWQQTNEKYFANVANYSINPDEEECLFRMGCVFRIEKVERIASPTTNGDGFWKVFLTTASILDSTNDEWKSFYNYMEFEIDQEPTVLHRLAKMMFILGEYAKAKEMYITLLETTSIEDRTEMAYLHFKLGRIEDDNGSPKTAYEHFCQAQDYLSTNSKEYHNPAFEFRYLNVLIRRDSFRDAPVPVGLEHQLFRLYSINPKDVIYTNLSSMKCLKAIRSIPERARQEPYIHLHLGHTLQQMGRLDEARNHLQQALDSYEKLKATHHTRPLYSSFDVNERYYSILAAILHDEGNLDEAFKYRMMCLRLQLARFHSIEKWKIGESYSEIASSYLSENNYIRAHEYYMKALTMQRKSLVPNHPMRAVTHSNLALVLESLGQLDEATHHSRLAVKILERTYGTKEHPRMRAYQLTYNSLFQKLLIERLNGFKQS